MNAKKVFLVHGIFDNGRSFVKIERLLRAMGYLTFAPTLKPNTGAAGLEVLAQALSDFIDQNTEVEESVLLIGFSMGGLVCRYYVQRLGGLNRIEQLVTLSTPHHGSFWARLIPNQACRQMRPGSAFLTDLNRDIQNLHAVNMVSIWTPLDITILPSSSSRIPGIPEYLVYVVLHRLMLRADDSLSVLARILTR
jgi:triacylglycerol lipase